MDVKAMALLPQPGAAPDDPDLASGAGSARRFARNGRQRPLEDEMVAVARRAAVSMAAAAIRACDGATGEHSDDVVHLCEAIADVLGVHGAERAELVAAAQLHDIGKIGLPQEVLLKPGPLDGYEWALIRQHTVTGAEMIESVPELRDIAPLVRHSHERWDGRGYPDGLAGEEIPLACRIGLCADAFHAIRSDRPYRRARPAAVALDEVKRNSGSQFDPRVVHALEESARTVTDRDGTPRSPRLVTLLT
jgi:putative nucleotidyltransferase with HDIG domain